MLRPKTGRMVLQIRTELISWLLIKSHILGSRKNWTEDSTFSPITLSRDLKPPRLCIYQELPSKEGFGQELFKALTLNLWLKKKRRWSRMKKRESSKSHSKTSMPHRLRSWDRGRPMILWQQLTLLEEVRECRSSTQMSMEQLKASLLEVKHPLLIRVLRSQRSLWETQLICHQEVALLQDRSHWQSQLPRYSKEHQHLVTLSPSQ